MTRHDIVPPHLAVQAMRDNGYKNAAYAIAELMDNSIQAEAKHVELLCGELETHVEQRRRLRIHQVAVLDDGTGMDAGRLRVALQFGNGAYLEEAKHTGIGRFGMGLPNSSISQCTRVDVWTWQSGLDSAIHSYLDIGEIRNQSLTEVPLPAPKEIPEVWRKAGKCFGKSGTLVVWSNIDRCMWRTANAIIVNSEFLIGRMYRRFLEDGNISIRLVAFDFAHPANVTTDKQALSNDPGYLIEKTSCPLPFDRTAMFNPFGEENAEAVVRIEFQGKKHDVKIRFSLAKEEARQGTNPGSLPHGKHAERNVGISIMRAGRELELDQAHVIKYDPVERWWGVEVEFPPALDELFGVTNNKQSARNFSELAKIGLRPLLESGQTISELKKEFLDDEDPRGPLLEIAQIIETRLGTMRRWLRAQTKGSRTPQRHQEESTAEQVATDATKERQKEGHVGRSDEEEKLPADERRGIIEQTLIDDGVMESTARELAAKTVSSGFKYVFAKADLEAAAFFSVKIRGGAIVISLNTTHPAYEKLLDVLEEDVDGVDVEQLQGRLSNALEGLRLLLAAWARYEDEQGDGIGRMRAQQAREDWGRIAYQFLVTED